VPLPERSLDAFTICTPSGRTQAALVRSKRETAEDPFDARKARNVFGTFGCAAFHSL
jgi:hypothetical protein